MSIRVMSNVWAQSKHKGSALLLLLAIADNAAEDGYCWPGSKYLAGKIRMSVRSVLRLVQALEKNGELYVIRSNINNRYVVMVGMEEADLHRTLAHHGIPLPESRGDKLSRDTGDGRGDKGVTSEVTQLCHPNHHEPSVNHQEEPPPPEPWPDSPRADPLEDKIQEKSILEFTDPLEMSIEVLRRRNGAPDWAVDGPEGVNPYYPVVLAFCEMTQQDLATIKIRKGRRWLKTYAAVADDKEVSPADMIQAHAVLPKEEWGAWYLEHHQWDTPMVASYISRLGQAAQLAKAGSLASGKIVRIRN